MKKFFGSIALCSAVLAVCSFVLVRVADADQARGDLITDLLNLPAPPPPNPLERATARRTDSDPFYSADNPPPDNAPIADILDYWAKQRYGNLDDNHLPSPVVLDRIAAAMESDPSKIAAYLNYLKDSRRGIASVRSAYNRAVAEEGTASANAGANTAANAVFDYGDSDYYDDDYDSESGRSGTLKRWLIMNDPTFSSELEPLAAEAKDTDNGYIQNDDEFLALARNDWGRARPLVDKMYGDANQPASKTLATWALYKKAIDDGSLSDAEKYREELKRTVENRQLSVGVRDLALDALSLNEEWSGRDDWYFSLMKDPTMLDFGGYTGLTTLITKSKTGKYKAKMIKLLESSDPTVRAAAARNLSIEVNKGDIDAIKALIPWLENPGWIRDTGNARSTLVRALGQAKMPESVHGLIAVMNERAEVRRFVDSDDVVANAADKATDVVQRAVNTVPYNSSNVLYNGPVSTEPVYTYPYRYSAITALAKQANPVAIPALRRLYNELANGDGPDSYMSGQVINALFASGGFSVPEQVAALESYARTGGRLMEQIRTAAKEFNEDLVYEIVANRARTEAEQFDEKLARLSAEQDEPSDALVAATIQRIKALEPRDPQTAKTLRDMVAGWNTRAANAMQLADLKDGKASLATVVNLLARRKQLRETQANDVYDARGGVPAAAGIATCILEDTPSYSAILNDANPVVKAAFLACARLIRIPLSPDDAARELSSPDKKLALAAKMYLISEDSARSRQILYATFPNEVLIAGSQTYFMGADDDPGLLEADPRALFASVDARFDSGGSYGSSFPRMLELQKDEKRFQKEILENEDIVGLYAYSGNVVRIYADRVTYDREDDNARSYRRVLSPQEFDRLKSILANNRVGEMKPFITCSYGCALRELVMLGRVGGSRVFSFAEEMPELFKQLDEYFDAVAKDKGVLHYSATDKVPGLQVIFADPRLTVETVWADGDDVRFFATDVAARQASEKEVNQKVAEFYRRDDDDDANVDYSYPDKLWEKNEYAGRGWYSFGAERIDPTTGPAGIELPPRESAAGLETFSSPWAARAGGSELQKDDDALYKVTGGNRVKIADGEFYQAAISPDGRWILGRTIDEYSVLVRIDAATGKTYPVAGDQFRWMTPVAWVPGVNKFLVSHSNYGGAVKSLSQLKFVDAVTGAITPVSGAILPFAQQSFRPLQPASGGGFWAAISDEERNETIIGVVDTPSLKFTKRVTIPDMKFTSMEMWVDEKNAVLYFVYSGHLLRMPVGK